MSRRPIKILMAVAVLFAWPALGQLVEEAMLVTDAVEDEIYVVRQGDVLLVPADKVVRALGGTVEGAGGAFTLELDGRRISFSETSRTALSGTEMIDMPSTPITIELRPFVPIELFESYLRPSELEIEWLEADKQLRVRERVTTPLDVGFGVTRIGPITKVVIELAEQDSYRLTRRSTSYVVRFTRPLRSASVTRRYDDPLVSRLMVSGRDVEIFLQTPGVAADSYELPNPPRVVLDLTAAAVSDLPVDADPIERPEPRSNGVGVGTIVIDPGHGGKEAGAVGPAGSLEKDLTLQISRRLARLLERAGWRVLLTRNGDQLVPHDDRTSLANQSEADLFLSVHLNAVPTGSAAGAETYFLSLNATDDRARLSAERENQGAPSSPTEGSDLDMILWDLAQQSYLKESSRFAEKLQDALAETTGVSRRGVKQAPFRVLVGAMMPAALVEVGFISNPEEERKLRSGAYQQAVAEALASAISEYRVESGAAVVGRSAEATRAAGGGERSQ